MKLPLSAIDEARQRADTTTLDGLAEFLEDMDTRGAIRTVRIRPQFVWMLAARSYRGKRARRQAFYQRQRDVRAFSRAIRSAADDQEAGTTALLNAHITGIGWVTMSLPAVDFPQTRALVPG
jgi:hypothetical protein